MGDFSIVPSLPTRWDNIRHKINQFGVPYPRHILPEGWTRLKCSCYPHSKPWQTWYERRGERFASCIHKSNAYKNDPVFEWEYSRVSKRFKPNQALRTLSENVEAELCLATGGCHQRETHIIHMNKLKKGGTKDKCDIQWAACDRPAKMHSTTRIAASHAPDNVRRRKISMNEAASTKLATRVSTTRIVHFKLWVTTVGTNQVKVEVKMTVGYICIKKSERRG